jgi:hypothetical protein
VQWRPHFRYLYTSWPICVKFGVEDINLMPLFKCEFGKYRWGEYLALLTGVCPYCVHFSSLSVDVGTQKSPSNVAQKLWVSCKSKQQVRGMRDWIWPIRHIQIKFGTEAVCRNFRDDLSFMRIRAVNAIYAYGSKLISVGTFHIYCPISVKFGARYKHTTLFIIY